MKPDRHGTVHHVTDDVSKHLPVTMATTRAAAAAALGGADGEWKALAEDVDAGSSTDEWTPDGGHE